MRVATSRHRMICLVFPKTVESDFNSSNPKGPSYCFEPYGDFDISSEKNNLTVLLLLVFRLLPFEFKKFGSRFIEN